MATTATASGHELLGLSTRSNYKRICDDVERDDLVFGYKTSRCPIIGQTDVCGPKGIFSITEYSSVHYFLIQIPKREQALLHLGKANLYHTSLLKFNGNVYGEEKKKINVRRIFIIKHDLLEGCCRAKCY
ncbi:hypothetical protein PV325_014036 [Microctonus aethiopoides]|nr:hypothetical protein PV325_014036 [Microctonus aethiopoides]